MAADDNDLLVITEAEAGERLDKILAHRFKEVRSRTYFQYLIDEQRVLVNGFPVKKRMKPQPGDEVEIEFLVTPELDLKPEPLPLDIIYEDDDILIVNKPAGLVVHPAVGHWSGTFVNALLYHCQHTGSGQLDPSSVRPGIVHRLDKDTTGLLMAAKQPLAQQRLIAQFASREVYKEYLAICIGNPGNKDIDAPIGRHPVHRQLMTVRPEGGKQALTLCRTLAHDQELSLVSLVLATGRTHQIRVHLKHIGTPVLGDPIYGSVSANKKYGVQRQMLHAKVLRLQHPITGIPLEFEAPLPEDMRQIVEKLQKD